jgi:hypothetical protein
LKTPLRLQPHIVTPDCRIANVPRVPVNDSGACAFKGPTQQQPSWPPEARGIPRAFAKYAQTG